MPSPVSLPNSLMIALKKELASTSFLSRDRYTGVAKEIDFNDRESILGCISGQMLTNKTFIFPLVMKYLLSKQAYMKRLKGIYPSYNDEYSRNGTFYSPVPNYVKYLEILYMDLQDLPLYLDETGVYKDLVDYRLQMGL